MGKVIPARRTSDARARQIDRTERLRAGEAVHAGHAGHLAHDHQLDGTAKGGVVIGISNRFTSRCAISASAKASTSCASSTGRSSSTHCSAMKKINVITLGCSKNTVDNEHLMARLAAAGYEVLFDSDRTDAKVVVIQHLRIHRRRQAGVDRRRFCLRAATRQKQAGRSNGCSSLGCLSELRRRTAGRRDSRGGLTISERARGTASSVH